VGSGKSSLMAALLGEMRQLSGEVYANGKVAFVPQTAWIPNDTLRNNVCFGRPYDESRYREVRMYVFIHTYI
jgi:ATP-binding cassette, subfamily C (CFTR/MRP), member 1